MRLVGPVFVLSVSVGGCTVFDTDAQRGIAFSPVMNQWTYETPEVANGSGRKVRSDVQWAFTTADVRVITRRMHPVTGQEVVCAEPGPDAAKALSTLSQITAQGGNGAVNAGLGFSGGSAEAAMELAGRSSALLAMRDGLFRACEAYSNGIIGQDMYAMITARYSQLLTTLFLGQDVVGATPAPSAPALSPLIAVPALPSTPAGGAASSATTTTATAPGATIPAAVAPAAAPSVATDLLPRGNARPPLIQASYATLLADTSGTTAAAVGANKPDKKAKEKATDKDSGKDKGTDDTPQDASKTAGQTQATAPASATSALVLGRMNEDYLNLGVMDAMAIACVNEGDPTRLNADRQIHSYQGLVQTNDFLSPICQALFASPSPSAESPSADFAKTPYGQAITAHAKFLKTTPMIDPTKAAAGGGGGDASPGGGGKTPDPVIQAVSQVQKILALMSDCDCKPNRVDGVIDQDTREKVAAFQRKYVARFKRTHVAANGDPLDPDTLAALHVKLLAKL